MQRRKIWKTAVAWAIALTLLAPMFAIAGEWQTYLREDFSSAQTMFYTGPLGTAYYGIDESGRYVVDGLTAPGDSMAILTDSLYYYYFQAECEVLDTLAGDLASCGLVFHYNKRVRPGQNSYYVFYVYSDGYYGVKRVVGDADGKVDILIPLAKTEMIDANYPNVLAVDAQGSRFDLYINGKYVDGFTDLAIDGGGFGFYATKQTKAAYDNFSVKIERRELGRDNLAQPAVNSPGASTESGFNFEGYSPPVIKKDPNRPLYPWEVGYVDPEDTKQTADEPTEASAPVDPPVEQPAPEPDPVRTEPAPPPDSGSPQASTMNQPTPQAAAPTTLPQTGVVVQTEVVEDTAPVDISGANWEPATGVQTHSYGDFGYDGNSSEVKLVPADALEEPAITSSEPEVPVTSPAVVEDKPAIEEAKLPSFSTPAISTPKIDIRPDWLLEHEPSNRAGSDSGHENSEADSAALPLIPEISPGKPEESKPANALEPVAKETSEPKVAKPVHRRSGGIGGNDEYWDDDPVDTRDYTKPKPKEKQPEPVLDTKPGDNAGPGVNDAVPADPAQASGNAPDGDKASDPLSLFPTEETTPTVAIPPARQMDTPEASGQHGEQPVEKVSVLSFREASSNMPPADGTDAITPQIEQPGSTDSKPETQFETPVIETEVVISTAPEPALPPEPEVLPAPEILEYQPAPKSETALPLFTPATPAEPELERPEQQPQITIIDDFSEQTWPTGDNGISSYRYFGAAYEIDNRMADTMAISFQQNELATAEYTVESEFLDGLSDVGYGLAAHFRVNNGNASYYGLFISHSGEYLLLKVIGGKEEVLVDWMPCNLLKPNMPNVVSLEISSPAIKVFINGKLITTVLDSSLRSGGYALLAGPGVAARFDNLVVNGDPRQ